MKGLPAELVIEKNTLNSVHPWIVLLEITLVNPSDPQDVTVLYLARNAENVTYDGHEYTAFPFEIEPTKYTSKGEIPTVTLRVSNITRVIQEYLERFNGGVGSTVKLIVVNTANLAVSFADLEMEFEIVGCVSDAQWIAFSLGAPNPLGQRVPLDRYLSAHCCWPYQGVECAYAGELPACKRTYDDCVLHANAARFGGFMGLRAGGLRVI